MREEHIIELLDTVPLGKMSENELSRVRGHVDRCPSCRRAYQAAQVSTLLLRQATTTAIEPSPFFETRVMAAIRERRSGLEAFPLIGIWKSAGALLSSMAALVLILTAVSISQLQENSAGLATDVGAELTDWAVFDGDLPINSEMSYGQVLTDIYYPESERENPDGNRQ
jgi:predicted anti-sigma-YlaC factor YlaD